MFTFYVKNIHDIVAWPHTLQTTAAALLLGSVSVRPATAEHFAPSMKMSAVTRARVKMAAPVSTAGQTTITARARQPSVARTATVMWMSAPVILVSMEPRVW